MSIEISFKNRLYTAEVIYAAGNSNSIIRAIPKLDFVSDSTVSEEIINGVNVYRYDLLHNELLFRPRFTSPTYSPKLVSGKYCYDFIVCQRGDLILLAVPYLDLAKRYFPDIDGQQKLRLIDIPKLTYTKLDINKLIMMAGQNASIDFSKEKRKSLKITQCCLDYAFLNDGVKKRQSIIISGDDLKNSAQYKFLMRPLYDVSKNNTLSNKGKISSVVPEDSERSNILSLKLKSISYSYSAKPKIRCTSYTDRMGNFKIRVGKKVNPLSGLILSLSEMITSEELLESTSYTPITQKYDELSGQDSDE